MAPKPHAQHTTGPWQIEGLFDGEVSVKIVSEEGIHVCEIEPVFDWTPEGIANAYLISTAPELLDSLKELVSSGNHMEAIARARTVIAKAER